VFEREPEDSRHQRAPHRLAALRLAACASVAMVLSIEGAQAQSWPPMPPRRPSTLAPKPHPAGAEAPAPSPPETRSPPGAKSAPAAPSDAAACLAKLDAQQVEAQSVPAPPASLVDCGIAVPVRVTAIGLAGGARLDLPDHPILDCAFATVFTGYVRELMAPLATAMLGSPIEALVTGPGYECRGRNRIVGAKTSAHGQGVAIDLVEIVLTDRRHIAIAHQAQPSEEEFLRTMRQAACGWFTTVLGPGSDAAHAEHMHFDIAHHSASDRYRICE